MEDHRIILAGLIKQSRIRGTHAYGLAHWDHSLHVEKAHRIEDITIPRANKIIYHNRYSTSGDYHNHENNQPIRVGSCALVFNGVLDMRTKKEIESDLGITMETENDGEILIQLCGSDPAAMQAYIAQTKGSFAGLMLTEENKMYALRNENRPLWRLEHQGAVFYASTKDIFKRVDAALDPQPLAPNQIYES